MRPAMATSSATATHFNAPIDHTTRRPALSLPLGPRWREQLLLKAKHRPFSSRYRGHGSAVDVHDHVLPPAARTHAMARDCVVGSGLFRRFASFPTTRYRVLQPFREEDPQATIGRPQMLNNPSGARKMMTMERLIAMDQTTARHVLLTFVPKAAASARQIDHVRHVMATLSRGVGFQRLLAIWEYEVQDRDEGSASSWVFVQDFQLAWIPLDLYCDSNGFTESTLRQITFDVVSMVHFLHTHELSASGQLCGNQDFMIDVDTQRVLWLISPALVLSGCLLAHATPRRQARDVSSIGYLMFHLSMVPHANALLTSPSEANELEELIRKHLGHLSLPCRAMMISCLTEEPAIEDLIKRKWLRPVEFVSIAPRLDYHTLGSQPHRRLVLHSLLWKLASFFMVDWLGNAQALGAIPRATTIDEEEVENPRRTRRSSSKRQYSGRHVSISAHSYPHHAGRVGAVGGNMLMRGMVIVPPLGSAILPPPDGEVDDKFQVGQLRSLQSRSFVLRDEDTSVARGSEDTVFVPSERTTPYDSFGYDFPVSPICVPFLPEYDAFEDTEGDIFSVEQSALDEEILEVGDSRRDRNDLLLLHENGHNHSMHSAASISDLRKVLRSLHPPDEHHPSDNRSDEREELHQFDSAIQARAFSRDGLDPVHLSAFGPNDIAFRETFRIDIWAYLRQQRSEMLETALEMNESEVAQRVQPMRIARGTLITVSIEPNDRLVVVGEECKSFRWRGEVNGVSFDLQHKRTRREREEHDETESLCIARVVAGTKVSLLFIRLKATVGNENDDPTPMMLSTRLEHVAADVPGIPSNMLEPVRPIGKGAFGEATLAVWKERNTHVVIKSPHSDAFQADSEQLEEFRHEAAVMQMLGKHPHVVELLGVTSRDPVSDDFSAIVTEYMPNGSLHDFLTGSGEGKVDVTPSSLEPLSLFSRTVMARDAAHGIVNIHQGHVLHRDIAARNCLLDEQFRVKVCDFGMSRLSSKTDCLFFDDKHHGFGPIKWMAPESVLPPHLFSTHSDSYMFGVLMYEIFSGQLPFPGISSRDAMMLILEGQHVPVPAYLPDTHQQLMKQCFDPHPLARPSMDEIFTTLDEWILQDTRFHSRAHVSVL